MGHERGRAGGVEGTWGRNHFSALSVIACTKRRWKIRNTTRIGMMEMTAAAIDTPGAIAPVSSVKFVSARGSVNDSGPEMNTSGVSESFHDHTKVRIASALIIGIAFGR